MSTMNPTDAVNVLKFLERTRAAESNPEGAAMLHRVEEHLRAWVSQATSEPINDGGPAFPMQDPQAINAYASAKVAQMPEGSSTDDRDRVYLMARAEAIGGKTLRDEFAGLAMQSLLSKANNIDGRLPGEKLKDTIARQSYEMADAMIRAREVTA